jgi:oligosaccharide repeat unit polymerase
MRPASPLFAFFFPWTLVLIGQQLALCGIIKTNISIFYWIIFANMATSFLIAFTVQTLSPQKIAFDSQALSETTLSKRFKKIAYGMLSIYFLLQILQVYYFKGFPLFWLATGDARGYFDFGMQSLNGLLNATYLLAATFFFIIYLKEKGFKKLCFLFFLLTVPILLVSRQLLISVFLQRACCTLVYHPKKIKHFCLFAVGILLVFITVGNYRTGLETLTKILRPESFVPPSLYSLLWIYAYIVTPFNNINAAIEDIHPVDAPEFELASLLPSVLRSSEIDYSKTGFSLVHENMNVSTFYFQPLLDFGPFYAFSFMALFQFILFLSFRRAVRTKAPVHIVEYSILYMIMFLSIFSNLFLFLPVLTQLIIIGLANLHIIQKTGIMILKMGGFKE